MKNYRVLGDSGVDLPKEIIEKYKFMSAPFKIDVGDEHFQDDENLDHSRMMEAMKASKEPVSTACPSPGEFYQLMEDNLDADGIFLIVLSKKLSGSYESAMVARDLFLDQYPDKEVHIVDSKSAAAGQTNVFFELQDLIARGLDFGEIKENIGRFVDSMTTMFVLEDLSNLIKNGRMSRPAGMIANVLSIKPVMKSNDGEIELSEISRGMKNSLNKMVASIGRFTKDFSKKRLTISHNRALDRAKALRDNIVDRYGFENIEIVQNHGLSSAYAGDKGIVIAFEG